MDRREFLKKSGGVVAGGILADLGICEQAAAASRKTHGQPNIVFILVDEMRFPSVFPPVLHTPEEFLRRFMPNVFYLWQHGVKFESYYSAVSACSPARATIHTGLYPHQEWLGATRTVHGPALQPGFPTYGRLLRQLGYQTPYFGKWHLSNPPANGSTVGYLENYGFQGMTTPDPIGHNGEGAAKDVSVIAATAAQWLREKASSAPRSAPRSASSIRMIRNSSGLARRGPSTNIVFATVTKTIHPRLPVGGKRGESAVIGVSNDPAELGELRRV